MDEDQLFTVNVLEAINKLRAAHNISPLILNSLLCDSALAQASDNNKRGKLDHYSADGSTWADRAAKAGYPQASLETIGENGAEGSFTPSGVVAAWMGDAGHRRPILLAANQHLGVGKAEAYIFADFGFIPGQKTQEVYF